MSPGRLERSTGWHHRTTAISNGNRQSLSWRPVWSRLKASFPSYSAARMAMCGSTGSPASSIPRIRRVSQPIACCFPMAGGIQTLRARRRGRSIVWACCFLETALRYPLHPSLRVTHSRTRSPLPQFASVGRRHAQTTSVDSGGSLFNQNGRGVGVTYTVVKGFCGSNFGISIRFAQLLVSP